MPHRTIYLVSADWIYQIKNETLSIGFIDYEKAFDFVNCFDIVKALINEHPGSTFINAVAYMYEKTYYFPKINTDESRDGAREKYRGGVDKKMPTRNYCATQKCEVSNWSYKQDFIYP